MPMNSTGTHTAMIPMGQPDMKDMAKTEGRVW
jgi:hypothetical protein